MSNLSSQLTSLQVPRRGVAAAVHVAAEDADAVDPYDVPQPQTATCCTALQRGVALDGLAQPRYAPLRTLPAVDDEEEEDDGGGGGGGGGDSVHGGKDDANADDAGTTATIRSGSGRSNNKKMVRKCKSTVDELKVSQLIQGPRLRRSVGMRRDWSFENLGNAA